MALQEQGLAAEALTGWQAGIRTDGSYGDARITDIDTTRIRQGLDSGKIVVVTGFQGICDGEITTLGRGGSDTSAVALAVALGAERCDIYTDVTAVHTADPRVVPQVGRHGRITYEEMLELANLGAKVLHPRSVDIARLYGLPVRVRSSWHVEDEGTLVCNDMEIKRSVSGVALDRGRARLSILGVSDRPGIADRIFGALAEAGISVDIIVQCASHDGVTEMDFTVRQQDGEAALKILRQVAADVGASSTSLDSSIAMVSVVGAGMIGRPGIASEMFRALSEAGINIQMVSTGEIRISCIVDESEAESAVRAVHDTFGLSDA
jgi:aspartate kinase